MENSYHLNISQAQEERLHHIDFKLLFSGRVNRNDIVSRFGVKEAAATRDISFYKNLDATNLLYDTRAKTYLSSDSFRPLFSHAGVQVVTALAHGFGDEFVGTSTQSIPTESALQINLPRQDRLVPVTRAIFQNKALEIQYHSLTRGASKRQIVPFALVDSGLRWHVRAYDRLRERFSDFVINRIEKAKLLAEENIPEHETKASDNQWNRIVELHLTAHPQLNHPRTIEEEYGMESGVLKIEARAAVAGYILRRWNVDCSKEHALNGPENHLWLKNQPTLYGVENLTIAPGYELNE